MSDLSFKPTGVDWHGEGYGIVQFGNDERLVVIFYTKSVLNVAQSREKNRPVYENVPYVRIHPAGERLNVVDRPVSDADKHRFTKQWGQYMGKQEQIPDGTPVDLLFPNNPAVADYLKGANIYTVEQLANLSANAIDTVGTGAQNWVNSANKYLESALSGSSFIKMQEENKEKDQQIRMLSQQVETMKTQMDALIRQFKDPNLGKAQPEFQPGYDVQEARINSTHVTSELASAKRKNAKN